MNMNANTNYNIYFRKFDQAYIKPASPIFKIFCIKNGEIISQNTYAEINNLVGIPIDAALINITSDLSIAGSLLYESRQKF